MKSYRNYLCPALALAALTPTAWAEKDVVLRRIDVDAPRRVIVHKDDDKLEKEKVTYLGVETAPMNRTLGAQLGLARDTGLVIVNVVEKSPAADVLKEDDVLTKFEDQILIDSRQLGVLVRGKKDGDEVKLTLIRGGKEMTIKVKLAVREVIKHPNAFFYQNGEPGGFNWKGLLSPEPGQGMARLRELPGMGPDDARDVLRMIEHERGNFLIGPGVRIRERGGRGSTIVDLPKSNISYSDDDGSIEIKVNDGKRNLTVKDAKGVVAFDGPINTDEERHKLPAGVSKRLEKLESETMSFEIGGDFKADTVPLLPEPAKTKIGHPLPHERVPAGEPAARSF